MLLTIDNRRGGGSSSNNRNLCVVVMMNDDTTQDPAVVGRHPTIGICVWSWSRRGGSSSTNRNLCVVAMMNDDTTQAITNLRWSTPARTAAQRTKHLARAVRPTPAW